MSRERYYFPEIIENNALNHVAQLSKQMLKEGETIVEIFRKNYNLLYVKSPDNHSLLMKQNSQSIFDLSPINLAINKTQESCFRIRKSSECMSTPVKTNTTLHRKCLSIDDTFRGDSESTISETEMESVNQRMVFSPKNATQSNIDNMVNVPDIAGEVFVSTSPSTCNKSDDSSVENINYPCPNSADSETHDHTFASPNVSKMTDNPEASNQESPRSEQTTKLLVKLNMDGSESCTPPKPNTMSDMLLISQQYPDNHEQMAENYYNHGEIAENSDKPHQIDVNSANHEQVFENSDDHDRIVEDSGNICTDERDSNVFLEEGFKIPNSTTEEKQTPSRVKLAKVTRNIASESEVQVSVCTDNEAGISSNLDTKVTDISFRRNKNISPIVINKTLKITEEKRKSPSPRRNKLFFRGIPKIICLDGSDEVDIEFSCDSEGSPSPTTSKLCSRDSRFKTSTNVISDNAANESIGSDVLDGSNVNVSPKSLQRGSSPLQSKTKACSSENIAEKRSPTGSNVTRKSISPSTKLFTDISPKAEKGNSNSSATIYSESDVLEDGKVCTSKISMSPTAKTSPKLIKFSPSDQKSSVNIPDNSPSETKDVPRQISPSWSCFTTKNSEEIHCDNSNVSKIIAESDSNILRWFMNKLTKLVSLRDKCMDIIFGSFSEFQKDLNTLFFYMKKLTHVLQKISTVGQVYVTEEVKNVAVNLTADAQKLEERINLWKTAGDKEVQAWIKCFEEIRIIKSRNETCYNTEVSTVECMRSLRSYEKDLKSIWKKMDDMKMLEDARRSLLVNTAHDFELLIKQFIKCLIVIGALKLRKKSSCEKP